MSEMVERVAKRLWEADSKKGSIILRWETYREDYERSARVAIEAMREPTKEMIDKGGDILKDCVDSDRDSVDGAWDHEYVMSGSQTTIYQAMITAALSPSREDEGK